ncbi:exosome complex subunit [Niveomyces insectorum RCEF 264]|uniref:Exosome complex subunit n=1 Tax=Niveomyces insectorum RCEF 264 TaxID=1081102 RepID=A0A167Z3E1_9HYPO|nr:exosome complex subunit [Niveomyces insectorum RCEF 264]
MAVAGQVTVPGQLLGPSSKYLPGPGTHLADGQVYASLLGHVQVSQPTTSSAGGATEGGSGAAAAAAATTGPSSGARLLPKRLTRIVVPTATHDAGAAARATVSVSRARIAQGGEVLPDVGNTVLCRVTRITQRQAVVAILVVGETVLDAEWQGLIRAQDVRATEKDRVKIYESFRPGDIISLGDQANYYLSTASNTLGVVMATSEAGNPMYPVSWKEYIDPETGLSEPRKVAKPF